MFEDRGERWRGMPEPGFVDPPVRESIPDLDSIPPGPYLAAILASIDRSKLNGYDLVIVLRADDRMASHYQAQRLADMVELAHCAEGSSDSPATRVQERQDFASDEVRAALSLTRRSAETQLGLAVELAERLPRILEAFRAGRLSLAKVWVIVRATSHLPADTAAEVSDRVLEEAETMTTGQLGARLRKLCIEADPESAEKRYEESLADRRVAAEPNVEGTANSTQWSWNLTTSRPPCGGSTRWRRASRPTGSLAPWTRSVPTFSWICFSGRPARRLFQQNPAGWSISLST